MKKILLYMSVLALTLTFFTGCGRPGQNAGSDTPDSSQNHPGADSTEPSATDNTNAPDGSGDGQAEEMILHAILLRGQNDTWLFADTETHTPFTAPVPDNLTDADGKNVKKDQLKPGNRIDIYGNGIMLESYPGQYPGVTKMIVTDEGHEKDTREYQDIIDMFFAEPDLSEPPALSITYTHETGTVSASLTGPCNYEWTAPDDSSDSKASVIACGPHVLQWKDVIDISLSGTTDVRLEGEVLPDSITVTRWPSDLYQPDATEGITENGETVKTETDENGAMSISAEPGYIYLVTAEWKAYGNAEYAFLTVSPDK